MRRESGKVGEKGAGKGIGEGLGGKHLRCRFTLPGPRSPVDGRGSGRVLLCQRPPVTSSRRARGRRPRGGASLDFLGGEIPPRESGPLGADLVRRLQVAEGFPERAIPSGDTDLLGDLAGGCPHVAPVTEVLDDPIP